MVTSICEQCGKSFECIPSPKNPRLFCDKCRRTRKRESEVRSVVYAAKVDNGVKSWTGALPDHALSMKPGSVIIPKTLQRMTPDQIVRAFERGMV